MAQMWVGDNIEACTSAAATGTSAAAVVSAGNSNANVPLYWQVGGVVQGLGVVGDGRCRRRWWVGNGGVVPTACQTEPRTCVIWEELLPVDSAQGFYGTGGKEQRLFCRAETLALSRLVKRLRDSQRRGEKREAKRRVEMRGGDKENIAS